MYFHCYLLSSCLLLVPFTSEYPLPYQKIDTEQVDAYQNHQVPNSGDDGGSRLRLPADLILLSALFPFPPSIPGEPINGDRFVPFLPDYMEALRICEIYLNDFSWW